MCYDQGKYRCPLCPLVFNTMSMRREHHNKVHSTDETLKCKHCGKRCRHMTDLLRHQKTHEDGEFQCKYCPKKLKSEEYLIAHERYHTGEKPFKCSMCTNAFVNKDRLRQHMRGVHNIVGVKGGKPGWKRKNKWYVINIWNTHNTYNITHRMILVTTMSHCTDTLKLNSYVKQGLVRNLSPPAYSDTS